MKLLDQILKHNRRFVEDEGYQQFQIDKYPKKKMVILSCMDSRLVELLPKAMNVRNSDANVIKTAGALVSHPFGNVMRSILVSIYELGASEVYVVGHRDCGMAKIKADKMLEKIEGRGVDPKHFELLQNSGVDFRRFLRGFDSVEESVKHSVSVIRNHPLIAKDIPVHGLVIDPKTGKLDVIVNGYRDA